MAGTITASVIKNDTTSPPAFQNSAGTEIGQLCRAWVNFNGITATIRTSFNVSSLTKNSTGNFTIGFTNALPDANYCVANGMLLPSSSTNTTRQMCLAGTDTGGPTLKSTTQLNVVTGGSAGAAVIDNNETNVIIFR